jgi:hypothetical protein
MLISNQIGYRQFIYRNRFCATKRTKGLCVQAINQVEQIILDVV